MADAALRHGISLAYVDRLCSAGKVKSADKLIKLKSREDRKRQIIEDINTGINADVISQMYGVSKRYMRTICLKNNITLTGGWSRAEGKSRAESAVLDVSNGLSISKAAAKYELSEYPIYDLCKKRGIRTHHIQYIEQKREMLDHPDDVSKPDGGRNRRMNAQYRRDGICTRCKKPHDRGTNRCLECTAKAVETNKRIKQLAVESGTCSTCRKPWSGISKNCDECKSASRSVWKARVFSGEYCSRCAGTRDSKHKACTKCRVEMRALSTNLRNSKRDRGLCVQCGAIKDAPDGIYCTKCILCIAARRWLGESKKWSDLKALLEKQNYRCAYTGDILVLGGNASVDHIVPRSRGGENIIDNLQWVTWQVNRCKTDMTHDEFVNMCSIVSEKFNVGVEI